MAEDPKQKSASKSDNKMWYILVYLIPVLLGIVGYVLYAQKDKNVKFHAVQAILYGIAVYIIYWILTVIFLFTFFLLWVPSVILLLAWLYGLYIGYQAYSTGKNIKIPVIGGFAEKA